MEGEKGAGGAVQLSADASHTSPEGARGRVWGAGGGAPCARRPIAKFNAKVMRARLRLRAAMQERPAIRAEPQFLTGDRDSHTRSSFTRYTPAYLQDAECRLVDGLPRYQARNCF